MNDFQNSDLENKLQGRTLSVYLYLQKKRQPSGIRELQRDLGLSSPSVAEYQIEKLVEMQLASRDDYGRVYVTKNVRVKALQSYVNIGHFTVPRLAFYASIFTAIAPLYVLFSVDSMSLYGVTVPTVAAGIFWYEAVKMWKLSLPVKASAKKRYDNRDFWVSLMPGLADLAVFVSAAIFLFYYVEPNGILSEVRTPIDPSQQIPRTDQPVTVDDLLGAPPLDAGSSSHGDIVSNFSPTLVTSFLFAGALVAGFLVYVLVKYRSSDVLAAEQGSTQQF